MEGIYVLNPDYILRNDVKRVILAKSDGEGISTFIHPLHGMILSFFDSSLEYSENVKRISESLQLKEIDIINFTSKLVNNSEKIWIGEGSNASHFPEKILIPKPNNYKERKYHFRDFLIDGKIVDLSTKRFYIPIETILMINSICATNCVYCYADRNNIFDSNIPFERICEIIDEAKLLKFRKFDVSGGEFFLYKHWEKLLRKMISVGFNPTIPTKIPLSFGQIKKIKDTGLEKIQISLDTTNSHNLSKILKVSSEYWEKMKICFNNLEKIGIRFRVNTVVTSFNCNFNEIDNLIEYLHGFNNFVEISIGIVGYSLYKSNEENKIILPKKTDADFLMEKLKMKYGKNEKVILSDISLQKNNYHFAEDAFFKKAMCTGNMHLFYILADGKVTLCEELYWHPKFIIGDLTKQSIMEMWNSKEAMELYNLNQNVISVKSACSHCGYFTDCHVSGNKCWREILKVYGKENWDYPDPRCPFSPEPINTIYVG